MTAITTTQVTGRVALADDTSLTGGRVEFLLTGFETDTGSDVTIVHDAVSADIDAAGDIDVDLWPNEDGVRATQYKVTAVVPNVAGAKRFYLGQIVVPTSGPVDLNDLLDTAVIPITYDTDDIVVVPPGPVGVDRVSLINSTFTYCVANNAKAIVRGDQYITGANGSVEPGGTYVCEWVNATLIWAGSDVTDLTEVMENPVGTTSPQGSGKYVLFDTKNCTGASNSGLLTIRGSSPGNMTLANRANIPADLVAITASESTSADMIWDGLTVIGCGYGLWQGDQRGSAPNILPYTRWSVTYFKAQFCNFALVGGISGNAFDDGVWNNVRLTRNLSNGTIRTDFVCNSILLNGMRFQNDAETWTASTTADSTTVTTSAAHGLSVGQRVAIKDANDNLDGSLTTALVSRISAVPDATTLTLETAADNTTSGKEVIVNPPSFFAANASLVATHAYVEEVHDVPIDLRDQARIWCPDFKVSDGVLASRYNVAIAMIGFSNVTADIGLHQRSGQFLSTVKYTVGVAPLLNGADFSSRIVQIEARDAEAEFTESKPVGVIQLESDHAGANTAFEGLPQGDQNYIAVRYTDGWQAYDASMWGDAFKMLKNDGRSIYQFGSNLTSSATVDGMTAVRQFSAPSSGSSSKTAGGTGALYEDISISPGDTLIVDVTCASMATGGFQIMLFDSGGNATPEGTIELRGPAIRGATTVRAWLTVPAGSTADRVGILGFTNAVGTFTDFTARKVEKA